MLPPRPGRTPPRLFQRRCWETYLVTTCLAVVVAGLVAAGAQVAVLEEEAEAWVEPGVDSGAVLGASCLVVSGVLEGREEEVLEERE